MNAGIILHECGHLFDAMSRDDSVDAGYIRNALDGTDEVEALHTSKTDGGIEDAVIACVWGLCALHPDLAAKLLLHPAQAVSTFEGIVAEDAPDLHAATFCASQQDIDTLRAGHVDTNLWLSALALGVMVTKARTYTAKMSAMLAEFQRTGLLRVSRAEIFALIPA